MAGPAANPTDVAAVSTPNERPMISLGMNFTQIIGAHAIIIEAPRPWIPRAMMSIGRDMENPQITEDIVNKANPAISVFLM